MKSHITNFFEGMAKGDASRLPCLGAEGGRVIVVTAALIIA
jgi:hypothetical protein